VYKGKLQMKCLSTGSSPCTTYPGLTELESAVDGVVLSEVHIGGGGVVPPAKFFLLAGGKHKKVHMCSSRKNCREEGS